MALTKGVQVSATIPKPLELALEDYRWRLGVGENPIRLSKTELIRVAIEEYAANHGLNVGAEQGGSDE